ncbi:hypothetical protein MK805_08605 [Shimazuella sp. AN120528]|uniref:hypothetical protein n=1 Tax=Shimazuella soli TaxID=1892854 RepID=UPI001F0F72CD|nr:hypothetical protein [Shimazuella soli]MCH5585029.1 hypothetical protein [Shimazuella soli]
MDLYREELLGQAQECVTEMRNSRRDFREKRRGYTQLVIYYTIMARIARCQGESSTEVDKLLEEAEQLAGSAKNNLKGNPFQHSSGLDNAEAAVSLASLAEEMLQEA